MAIFGNDHHREKEKTSWWLFLIHFQFDGGDRVDRVTETDLGTHALNIDCAVDVEAPPPGVALDRVCFAALDPAATDDRIVSSVLICLVAETENGTMRKPLGPEIHNGYQGIPKGGRAQYMKDAVPARPGHFGPVILV